jgi:hypothetical protein
MDIGPAHVVMHVNLQRTTLYVSMDPEDLRCSRQLMPDLLVHALTATSTVASGMHSDRAMELKLVDV